jgi:transcription elongation GreA/GreB family factor
MEGGKQTAGVGESRAVATAPGGGCGMIGASCIIIVYMVQTKIWRSRLSHCTRQGGIELSVAFTKEDSAETASETLLPDRAISTHPNLVTEAGLKALELQLQLSREAYEATRSIEDVNERRRQAAIPLRDARYFAERVRSAQIIPNPASADIVAFGSAVTFSRGDGRVQTYRIVGEDEADPRAGSISFVSPVARFLMGKAVGDVVDEGGQELEIIAIS